MDDLNAFLKEKHARGVRNTSINSGLVLLRSFFVWLEDQELYTDITRGIDIEGAECYRERVALNAEQVRRLVDETTDVKMRAMFALMAFCGLRCVEVSELNWGDISDGRAVVRGKGRNAKTEVIVLPISVQRALEDWRRVTQAQTDGDAPVFVYSRRKATSLRMSPAGISTDVQRALREVFPDIPNLSAHCLRHTAITLAIESGLDVTRVAKFARHKDIKTTMVYIHDNKKFTDPVSGRIEAMVQGERTSHDAQAIESIVRDVLRKLLRL